MNKLIFAFLCLFIALISLARPALAADVLGPACTPATKNSSVCQPQNPDKNPVVDSINRVANIIAVATGVGAVIMIVVGGLTLVTSAGNAENIAKARRRIIYSIIGLVVVALAWTIIHFVTDKIVQ